MEYGENVRLPTGQLRDQIRQPLYDTITIAASESPVGIRRFFQSVAGKTLAQTNLKLNGSLEAQTSFRVKGMHLESQCYQEDNRQVLPIIMEKSSLEFQVTNKVYYQGNGTFWAGRLDSFHAVSTGTGTATDLERVYQRYGAQAVQGVLLDGKQVVDIRPLANFFVQWTVDTLTGAQLTAATPASGSFGIVLICKLTGHLRRPVQ